MNQSREAYGAVDGDAAFCMIEECRQMNTIQIKYAPTTCQCSQFYDQLVVIPVATIHRVNLEDELCIFGRKLKERLRNKLNELLHALKIGTLRDLAI